MYLGMVCGSNRVPVVGRYLPTVSFCPCINVHPVPKHFGSVADPDPSDPYVFGHPGSGSIKQRYGSGSFYHKEKMVRKTLTPTVLWLLFDFDL
jgi:hypothetical protein